MIKYVFPNTTHPKRERNEHFVIHGRLVTHNNKKPDNMSSFPQKPPFLFPLRSGKEEQTNVSFLGGKRGVCDPNWFQMDDDWGQSTPANGHRN